MRGFPDCELNFLVSEILLFGYSVYLDELPIYCALMGFVKKFLPFRKCLHYTLVPEKYFAKWLRTSKEARVFATDAFNVRCSYAFIYTFILCMCEHVCVYIYEDIYFRRVSNYLITFFSQYGFLFYNYTHCTWKPYLKMLPKITIQSF